MNKLIKTDVHTRINKLAVAIWEKWDRQCAILERVLRQFNTDGDGIEIEIDGFCITNDKAQIEICVTTPLYGSVENLEKAINLIYPSACIEDDVIILEISEFL